MNGREIPAGESILLTDIEVENNPLRCVTGAHVDTPRSGWYIHPTMPTTSSTNIATTQEGWRIDRVDASDFLIMDLIRIRSTVAAHEGVFTCDAEGAINSPRSLRIYYPSEPTTINFCYT